MTTITSRPISTDDEKCSSWPPLEPSGEPGFYFWNPETQSFQDTPVNKVQVFGEAPNIITDSMDAYKFPVTGETIDSKSKLRRLDKLHGTITSDKKIAPDPTWQNDQRKARDVDRKVARHKAIAQLDSGVAVLPEAAREVCARENERISKALNFDAFNVAGKKNDRRGKKYRRK